jgi:hypothetical protein
VARKKTAAELRAENRLLRQFGLAQSITAIVRNIVTVGGAVLIARYAYLSIRALSGQTTAADIGINFLADVKISQALAWLLAGGGVGYGIVQDRLRRSTIRRLEGHKEQLEKLIDPGRTSSRLTASGGTNPEDRL